MLSLRVALGKTIRRLRAEAGFSQESFASACGVHRTYMTSVEQGRRNVSLDTIEKVAKALDIDTGQLMVAAEVERLSGPP